MLYEAGLFLREGVDNRFFPATMIAYVISCVMLSQVLFEN